MSDLGQFLENLVTLGIQISEFPRTRFSKMAVHGRQPIGGPVPTFPPLPSLPFFTFSSFSLSFPFLSFPPSLLRPEGAP